MPKNDEITAQISIFSDQDLRNWSYSISIRVDYVEYHNIRSEPKFSDSQEAEKYAKARAGELIRKTRKKLNSPDYFLDVKESDYVSISHLFQKKPK